MGILEQEYNRIYDMLDEVLHRPAMYIGQKNCPLHSGLSTLQPSVQTQVSLIISPAV